MKKILSLIFFLAAFYLLLSAHSGVAFATWGINDPGNTKSVGSWFVQDPATWQQQTFGGDPEQMDANKYGVFMVTNLGQTIVAALGGVETTVQTPTGMIKQRSGGAIGLLAGLSGSLYNTQPASSIEYLADLGNTLGIVKPAYAQGLGFNNLSPVLTLWKTFRDIAYLAFVVIFVIVGFMIMFRKKIDPRTVVTIQEALPRIVIALILVTFSYAIVGLMIDLMQVASSLIINIMVKPLNPNQTNAIINQNIFDLYKPFGDAVIGFAIRIGSKINLLLPLVGHAGKSLGGLLAGLTVAIVIGLATFFTMFKIFFMLLGAYVEIILAVIFGPIQLVLTALPGNNSVTSWLRNLLASIAVFPATILMMTLAYIFIAGSGLASFNGSDWQGLSTIAPTVSLTWAPPLMGTKWGSEIGILIAFGILNSIPAVGEAIKHALEIKPGPMAGVAEKQFTGQLGWVPFIGNTLQNVTR